MIIDKTLLDRLTEEAKQNPRFRQSYDLRTTKNDGSQRMLNAMEPSTVLPIHRHMNSTETIIVLRGRVVQHLYNNKGELVESIFMAPNTDITAMSVEISQWHRVECLESGTIILEAKDGKYESLGPNDILNPLKHQIENLIEMEKRSGSMEVVTSLYISRMLNIPLGDVEKIMADMK